MRSAVVLKEIAVAASPIPCPTTSGTVRNGSLLPVKVLELRGYSLISNCRSLSRRKSPA
jgi:hypothetical protein